MKGSDFRGGPGFTTAPSPTVKAPPADPRLAIPDPLKPRLKKGDGLNDSAEARYAKQRQLIDAYKKENPRVSTNKMFAELEQAHPDVFHDDDDDGGEEQAKATHHPRWTRIAS